LTGAADRKPLADGPKGFYSYFLLFHRKMTNFMWLFTGGKLKRPRKIVPKIAAAQKQESGNDYADDHAETTPKLGRNYMAGIPAKAGNDYASDDYMMSNFPPGVPQGPDCDKRPDGKCA
jgi:hypothetical protein